MKSKYSVQLFLCAICFRRLNPSQALTRTLTTLYTITLLSLLTAVQLNVLGRSRYIDSVRIVLNAHVNNYLIFFKLESSLGKLWPRS